MFSRSSKCLILRFLIFLFALVLCPAASLVAGAIDPDDASPVDVIRADVTAQNNHDWSTFLAIRTPKAGPPENRNDWIKVRNINPEADIMKNIVTVQLAGIKPLPFSLAEGLTRMDKYLDLYSEVRAYYVAIDYRLKEENRSFYNGVNYRFYVLASEEGNWVIVEASEAPVHRMIEAGYGFGTPEEMTALRIQEERELTGKFINPKGEVIEILAAPVQVAGDHQCPSFIKVYRVELGQIDTVDFYTYVKNVLPNEWIASWPEQSLLAGALACKMYGWYHVYYAEYPGQGYDVRDDTWDQVYEPGTEHPNTNKAIDDVNGIGVDRADGELFETQYCAGTYGPEKPGGEMLGRMSQWGTKYWADMGEDYSFMVHYYWDNSPQAGGQLAHFFNYGTPKFDPGDTVEVYNTGGSGLLVRGPGPCDSPIGGKFDGDVGVVLEDPPEFCDGYNRWRIHWIDDGLEGWSAEDWLREIALPDLIVDDIWVEPAEFHPGDEVQIYARIQNLGDADAGSFLIEVYFDGNLIISDGAEGLGAGFSTTLPSPWPYTWPPDCEEHTIEVVIDADDEVVESDEDNNKLLDSFSAIATLTTSIEPPEAEADGCDISLNPPGGTYDCGTVVTLTANPESCWEFDHWSGDLNGSANPTTITMNSDKDVTANFTKIIYTLTTSIEPPEAEADGCDISLNPPGGTYDCGTVVTLTANPESCWEFDHWSGDLNGSANPTTITMNSDKDVTANFTKIIYTLTTSIEPPEAEADGCDISLNPPGGTYDCGTVVTLTANPESCWEFDHWSGDLNGSANPTTITMNSDKDVTANFATIELVVKAGEDKSICHPNNYGSTTIGGNPTASGGTPPYNYSWEPADSLDNPNIANPTATPTKTTTYTVTVTDSSTPPQEKSDTVTVTVYPELIAKAGDDKPINLGETVQIGGNPTASGGTSPYTYSWQPADTLDNPTSSNPNATPTETTTYTVTVTDANGCVDTDEVTVIVNQGEVHIYDIRVSNLTSAAAVVSWTTNVNTATNIVHYGTTIPPTSTAEDTTVDDVHWVQISGLTAETTYYYSVESDGVVDDNGGAYYQFTTTKVGTGNQCLLYGMVYKEDGVTPAARAAVYVRVTHGGVTSAYLSVLTAAGLQPGTWNVNLANLKDPNTGEVLSWSFGDAVEIEVHGAQDGKGSLSTTLTECPQDVGEIIITQTIEFSIPLKTGLNLIALPADPLESKTSFELIPYIGSGICKAVSMWDKDLQLWKDALDVGLPFPIGEEFPIIPGEGYFLLVNEDTSYEDIGYPIVAPITLDMKTGLNLVGIPYPSNPPVPPGYTGYTSFTLIPAIGSGICKAVSMWDNVLQQWKDAIDVGLPFPIGEEFDIVNDEGYFLLLTEDKVWSPEVPTGISIAQAAPNMIDKANITALYRSEANSSLSSISRITESNLSSSSVTISWTSDAPSNGAVLYGQTLSLRKEARSIAQGGYTHWARLKGLVDDTVYYYKVVSDNSGKLRSFRTPGVRLSPNPPHLLYGKVQIGGTPKEGVIVYAKIGNDDGASETISTLTGKSGVWLLNSGNFNGEVKAGDTLRLYADGGILGYANKEIYVVSVASPQDVGVLTLLPSITQKAEVTLRVLPKKSALLQNFPNPFNPETWIPYQLAEGSDVVIRIYNVAGQLVRELELNYKRAGFYIDRTKAAYWDGRNSAGESVASGVYFYQIKAGKFVSLKKLVILK